MRFHVHNSIGGSSMDAPFFIKVDGNSTSKGAVTFLAFSSEKEPPIEVIKIPRDPKENSYVFLEATSLINLHNDYPDAPFIGVVPKFVKFEPYGSSQAVVITGMSGKVMFRGINRVNVRNALQIAANWLATFHQSTSKDRGNVAGRGNLDYLCKDYPVSLGYTIDRRPPYSRYNARFKNLQERIQNNLLQLPAFSVPLSTVHGDFSPHNLLSLNGKITGVIDWEESREDALPFEDLFHFAFVLFSSRKFSQVHHQEPTPYLIWERLLSYSELIEEYIRCYSVKMRIDPNLPYSFIPWYFLVTAIKELLPWRMNPEASAFWLELADASMNTPYKPEKP